MEDSIIDQSIDRIIERFRSIERNIELLKKDKEKVAMMTLHNQMISRHLMKLHAYQIEYGKKLNNELDIIYPRSKI